MPSKLIIALLSPSGASDSSKDIGVQTGPYSVNSSMTNNTDFLSKGSNPSGNTESSTTGSSVLHRVYNDSIAVVQDILNVPSNTPLTAKEAELVTVSSDSDYLDGDLFESHTDELAWLIPAVIGVILMFVFFALLAYFGIRVMELRCMHFCFRTFGCCDPTRAAPGNEERVSLSREMKYYNADNSEFGD